MGFIEREIAIDRLEGIGWFHVNDEGRLVPGGTSQMETYVPYKEVETMLNSIPADDVAPVRHGRWNVGAWGWECSERAIESNNTYPICPYCGAEMDGKEEQT